RLHGGLRVDLHRAAARSRGSEVSTDGTVTFPTGKAGGIQPPAEEIIPTGQLAPFQRSHQRDVWQGYAAGQDRPAHRGYPTTGASRMSLTGLESLRSHQRRRPRKPL